MTAAARASRGGSTSPTISLRVPWQRRDLIDRAARATGKTRTEFILESATRAAEEALLDRLVFHLDVAQYDAFEKALDAPPRPTVELRKLFAEPPPWERRPRAGRRASTAAAPCAAHLDARRRRLRQRQSAARRLAQTPGSAQRSRGCLAHVRRLPGHTRRRLLLPRERHGLAGGRPGPGPPQHARPDPGHGSRPPRGGPPVPVPGLAGRCCAMPSFAPCRPPTSPVSGRSWCTPRTSRPERSTSAAASCRRRSTR